MIPCVMVNDTGKKKLTASAGINASEASPEFYLKKSGNGYIVYTMQRLGNDSTLYICSEIGFSSGNNLNGIKNRI